MKYRREAGDARRYEGGKAGLEDPKNEVAVAARNVEHLGIIAKSVPGSVLFGRCGCPNQDSTVSRALSVGRYRGMCPVLTLGSPNSAQGAT